MRILLITPPCRTPNALPLGLGYIASVLREDGHQVSVMDINGFGYAPNRVEELVKGSDFDLAGIGGLSTTYGYVKWLAGILKKHKPGLPVIAGNMVSTAHPETLLTHSDVDIAVVGEGENTMKELVKTIKSGGDLKSIHGIVYKNNGNIVRNPARQRIVDLDSLPFPAWDMFPMETYLTGSTATPESYGRRSINVVTTRGCPYDCTFCSRCFGKQVFSRSPKNIVEEIKELVKRYKVKFIGFSDELFLVNKPKVMEFCDRVFAEGLNIRWSANARVNVVNYDLLKIIRRAGCVQLGYGFESGSQKILDNIKKGTTVKQAGEAIKITRKAGIRISPSFVFGLPGENMETIKETLDFIRRNQIIAFRFFYANPYPNTELYDFARKIGRLPADEDKYLESLGEQLTTFRINLTDFPDQELVRLKNWTEARARGSLKLGIKSQLFIENWERRLLVLSVEARKYGLIAALKKSCLRFLAKIKKVRTAG